MSTYYCLRIVRAEDLLWQPSLLSRTPDLYVKANLGDIIKKTRRVKQSLSPVWDESFVFSSSDASITLVIQVKHKSEWQRDPCIGRVEMKLIDLLTKCSPGRKDATLCLSSGNDGAVAPTGKIILNLDDGEWNGAEISLAAAEEDIRHGKIMRYAGSSDVTQSISDRASQMTNQRNLCQAVLALIDKLDEFQRVMTTLSEIHPFLTIAWKLASSLYLVVRNVLKTDQRIVDLVRSMVDAFTFVRDLRALPDKAANLQQAITGLLKQTIECCLFVRHYASHGFLRRMVDVTSSQKIDEFERSLASFKQQIESGVVLHTAVISTRMPQKINGLLLRQLLNPSQFDAFHRPVCLSNTRVEIRQTIVDWVFREDKQNIFWLHGVAGSGKSTISTTIAQHLRDMSRLGAFLFFERGKSDPSSVIRTIAYKLALFDSSIGDNIIAETEKDGDVVSALPEDQFMKLLQPLSQASTEGPILIVLDALDECGTPETRRPLMQLFREHFARLPKMFRFLITSRQEADIDDVLSSQPEDVREVGLDYTSAESQQDVLAYLREEMCHAVRMKVPSKWQWEDAITSLGKAAGGLFIWASTAVKLVSTSDNPFRALKRLVSDSCSVATYGLDSLYATVLRDSGIEWTKEESRTRFLQVFYLVLFAKVPMSCETIDGILGFPPEESASLVLTRLRCLLSYSLEGPVRLFHASLSDYLVSQKCSDEAWFINASDGNLFILNRCFSVMKTKLHFNICNLETSFRRNDDIPDLANRVKACIPSHLEYACIRWSEHLRDVPYSPDVVKGVSDFAYRDLLFWFEVLSLVESFGPVANRVLFGASEWTNSHDPNLTAFLRDGTLLANTFSLSISQSTPHIYISMVPLSKDESIVSSHYSKRMSSMVQVQRAGTNRLLRSTKVLKTCARAVRSISVSQDGRLIGSSGEDGFVRVWDFHSGEELTVLEDEATSVSLFPDGRRLASCSVYGTWRIWDGQSGELILGPRRGDAAGVASAAVSPEGTRVALGLENGEVELFDVLDERVLARFVGHGGGVGLVAFSADGKLLASATWHQFGIWDVKKGKLAFGPFKSSGYAFSFSPDGKYITYVEGSSVKVLEVESGHTSVLRTENRNTRTSSATFSSCSTRIVVGSEFGVVRVLDVTTGDVVSGPFNDRTGAITTVAFTPDGRHVVYGSSGGTIRIWDISVEHVDSYASVGREDVYPDTFVGHYVTDLAISDDGSRIASATGRKVVIWDAKTGDVIAGPLDNAYYVKYMAYSRDNSRLVAACSDVIRVWDIATGQLAFDPIECSYLIDCIAISPGGTSLATGLTDGTLAVWQMADGPPVAEPLRTVSMQEEKISVLEFSPNGSRLASGSWDGNIKIWDTATWEVLSTRATDGVASIHFSPDSTQCVSISWGGVVTAWDTEQGDIMYGPYCANERARSLFFTQNGLHVLSRTGGDIEILRLHDGGAHPICDPLHSPETSGSFVTLVCSRDGSRIVSCFDRKIIRVWDTSEILHGQRIREEKWTDSTSGWKLQGGWIVGGHDGQDLLFWLPYDLRQTFYAYPITAVLNSGPCTQLSFSGAALGSRWTECFTPSS